MDRQEQTRDAAQLTWRILDRLTAPARERMFRRWGSPPEGRTPEFEEDAVAWLKESGLVAEIFRQVDPADEDVQRLVELGALSLNIPKQTPVVSTDLKAFVVRDPTNGSTPAAGVPLDQLAVMSAVVLELTARVAAALRPFVKKANEHPEELRPPIVEVRSGSIQFTVGGPLLASGVGLAIATGAGLVFPPAGLVGASLLAVAGVADLAVSWWKAIAEARKATTEERRTSAETPTPEEAQLKRHLELREKQLAIQKAERELAMMDGAATPSALVPAEEVRMQARAWGLSEAGACHLLNRTLPAVVSSRRVIGPMQAVVGRHAPTEINRAVHRVKRAVGVESRRRMAGHIPKRD